VKRWLRGEQCGRGRDAAWAVRSGLVRSGLSGRPIESITVSQRRSSSFQKESQLVSIQIIKYPDEIRALLDHVLRTCMVQYVLIRNSCRSNSFSYKNDQQLRARNVIYTQYLLLAALSQGFDIMHA
jgi:hypothetical protein